MKIVAGMGSIDAYPLLAEAGADEVFCGYVPYELASVFRPINRREVRTVNVQIGAESDLRILADMKQEIGLPVAIAFNAPVIAPDMVMVVADAIEKCVQLGFERFIIADPALLFELRRRRVTALIHVSGEMGEINRYMIRECRNLGAVRIILHRKMSIGNMQSCIQANPEMEYEAFVLNELCHFNGGFCAALHCDALPHMCREPYRLNDRCLENAETDMDIIGASGCGLCAISRLRSAGITHLKLVSRGNYIGQTIRDVRALKCALETLDHTGTEAMYVSKMKEELFPEGCSGNCYYRE